MKQKVIVISIICFARIVFGQNPLEFKDSIPNYFNEIKTATKNNYQLWKNDLYGPILLVDPKTRQVFANEPDPAGILKKSINIYSGHLPENVNIANTSIQWSGKKWAMIMLPLPQGKYERINLLAHELFHRAQPQLGFILYNTDNNHLDQKDGRIYLRLELEALKDALGASTASAQKQHLANALTFRKYRNSLYPGSDSTENILELHEGVAEYTGLMISGRNKKLVTKHLLSSMNNFSNNHTFVRSFAYHTIPGYGYLLHSLKKDWNSNISVKTNLANYFIDAFNMGIPKNLKASVEKNSKNYKWNEIIAEETIREEKALKVVADYKSKFIEQPHFEIYFEEMNVSFDPGNIILLEDKGTVYPTIRVTDKWGILTVEKGALMSPNWDKITLTKPTIIEQNKIAGDGWRLELTEGYELMKVDPDGNLKLTKN